MKRVLLTIILLSLTTSLFSQSITIGEDGIVRCKDVPIGTTQTIFGDTYEVVDRNLLIQRRDEGVDMKLMCVSNVTNMADMFRNRQFNQNISNWDVSSVTNMSWMFFGSPFNQPIGNWDVSNVTNMDRMFLRSSFNQPIGDWDVGKVTNMNAMFGETTYNYPLDDWNVGNVTLMWYMFGDSQFNQAIGSWDVSNVFDMSWMFSNSEFNQPIGDWDVSSVTDMRGMFRNSQFNQPLDDWDVTNVTNMGVMFSYSQFNQPIGNWDVSAVTNMVEMFYISSFNQPISNWDVSSVTDMRSMFGSSSFNQPIGDWDVSLVENMSLLFYDSPFNQHIGDWDVSSAIDMGRMFEKTPFNKPIENWDVSSTLNMAGMFMQSNFNQPIGNWDVSNVTNMDAMFTRSQFNQPIGNWDVSRVTNMESMFDQSPFNQPINYWCLSKIKSEPRSFSSRVLQEEFKPHWGTCLTPKKITLLTPFDNTTNTSIFPLFSWSSDTMSNKYQLQVFEGQDPIVIDTLVTLSTFQHSEQLDINSIYNWRVRGINDELRPIRLGEWSSISDFTTGSSSIQTIILISPTDNSINLSKNSTLVWQKEPNSQSYRIQLSTDDFITLTVDQKVTDTTFATPTLEYSTNYRWRVRGANNSGDGDWSTPWSFSTQIQPVGKVTLVSPLNNSVVELNTALIWLSEPNPEYYRVQLSTDGFTTFVANEVVTDTTFTTPQLEYLTQYQWRVRGSTADEDGEWSEPWSFTTIIEAPEKPVLLSPDDAITNLSVLPTLTWDASDRAEHYQIQLSTASNFSSTVADSSEITGTSFEPDKLQFNTMYYWRVRAINVGGESDWSETRSFFTEYALDTPILLSPTHESSDIGIPTMFSWQPVTGAFNYTLQISDAPSFENLINTASKSLGKSVSDEEASWIISQTVENLDYGKTYYWRVNASNDEGISDWSEVFQFTTEPAPITGTVVLSSPTNNQTAVAFPVEFQWEQFEAAEYYELQFSAFESFADSRTIKDIDILLESSGEE
jgi:surface protein